MRTILIDADTLIYRAGQRVEEPIQWNTWLWTLHSDLDAGILAFNEFVRRMQEELKADRVVMALSDYDTPNWRYDVLPAYKSTRTSEGNRRPIIWKPLREYCHEVYETWQRPGLEGDDVLGILLTHPKLIEGEKVCVSIDKDMNTLPGLHVNYEKAWAAGQTLAEALYEVTEEEADRFHMLQALAGDSTDGYPGAPGWGMTRSEKLLDAGRVLEPREHTFSRGARKGETELRWEPGREGSPWEIVVSAYESSGLSEVNALVNARVARICRASDFDFKNREVLLWSPSDE